jgi:hypothetical protein
VAWVGGLSALGGGGAHDSTPHISAQGQAKQGPAVDRLRLFAGMYKYLMGRTGFTVTSYDHTNYQ